MCVCVCACAFVALGGGHFIPEVDVGLEDLDANANKTGNRGHHVAVREAHALGVSSGAARVHNVCNAQKKVLCKSWRINKQRSSLFTHTHTLSLSTIDLT